MRTQPLNSPAHYLSVTTISRNVVLVSVIVASLVQTVALPRLHAAMMAQIVVFLARSVAILGLPVASTAQNAVK